MARTETRRLRKRTLKIDREKAVTHVIENLTAAQMERSEWLDKRLVRYAKLRGWLESKDYPWEQSSNAHLPVMMANSLRVKAGLYNAVLGIRPVMQGKPPQKSMKEAAERVDHLIDYQLFVENAGEKMVEKFIDGFVDDGTVVAFTHWAKDSRKQVDVRVFPTPEGPIAEAVPGLLGEILPNVTPRELVMKDEDGYRWDFVVDGPDGDPIDVELCVYDRDDTKIEVVMEWTGVMFNGPNVIVHELEDIVVPMRCENPQPITAQNPFGAPWIARVLRVDLDTIKRRMDDGTYDLLTKEDLDTLRGEPREPQDALESRDDAIRQEKDRQEGRSGWQTPDSEKQFLTMVEWYGRYDTDGDGRDEDVIFWVLKEAKLLCRARHLGEMCPGEPLTRPFAHECYIPVKGQFYGIGILELQEGIHDALHVVFNQAMDNGELANRPFGFYRASSGIKAEKINLWPGDLYPVDNPQTDVAFPQMPHADQTFMFNMFGLLKQLLDDETQIGPMQRGQVPQGKASALRTLGTTMAILQQGAAMPEQILRRLFFGLRQIWECVHKLNARFLPKNKNFLVAGVPLDQDNAYGVIEDPSSLPPVAFDFSATLMNTNKGVVSQALQAIGAAIFNPLAIQSGLVGPEQFYNWSKDYIQAAQLDPARYIKRPAGVPEATRILAEEAIGMLLNGTLPAYAPLEDPQEHLQKLQAFAQSENVGLLTPGPLALFKQYLNAALQGAQRAMQQQMMMQAAQQFSQAMGQSGQGQGPTGEVPPMQTEQPTQQEIAGANRSHE